MVEECVTAPNDKRMSMLEVDAFEESRRDATREKRDAALAPMQAALVGRTLADMWTDTREWVLEFSGPLWLRVFVEGDMVGWSVEHERPDVDPLPCPSTTILVTASLAFLIRGICRRPTWGA